MSTPINAPAGFYDDGTGTGRQRWFDGTQWTEQYQSAAPVPVQVAVAAAPVGRTANNMKVSYTRQQKGHSLTKHLLLGIFVLWIPAIYYSASPNHYWHV